MRTTFFLVALSGLAAAVPCSSIPPGSPQHDGFPNPNATQLESINKRADGSLSNAPPPPKLGPGSITAFQALAFGEEFEVAYFQSLLDNVTNNVPGFETYGTYGKKELQKILTTIVAVSRTQEELHSINAISTLQHFNQTAPLPCKYQFPTTNIRDAIAVAESFTLLVIGALQDTAQTLADNGDNGVERILGSAIGQEGEQGGFYRLLLGRVPSEKPFLTTSVASFTFSHLYNNFVIPGSCPFNIADINITIFAPLWVADPLKGMDIRPKDQKLKFTADLRNVSAAQSFIGGDGEGLFITYYTGQLLPISEPVSKVTWEGSKGTFEAFFPFEENVMQGLSIAALTTQSNFSDPAAVPDATLAAPAIIQVNDLF
ncbi:hypothetical protein F5884DRAFT_680000 [Xylogone sp. PMI_703]|nr:hypothetical protein F5884DRAFT_680000 [Xylogone sp. PMI_703]